MRFIGRREGVSAALVRQMDWAEELTAANRRITLFVAFNYGGRAEILDAAERFDGRRRGGVPRAAVRAGDARPGPDHPHQRRAAAVQLPAVAVRLLGAGLPRRAVAGLHARGLRGVARRVRRAPAAAMAAGEAARPQAARGQLEPPPAAPVGGGSRRAPPGRRTQTALGAERAAARRRSRRSRSPLFIVSRAGCCSRSALLVLGCLCLHELYAHVRARASGAPRRLRALLALLLAALLRQPAPGAARRGRGAAGAVPADAAPRRAAAWAGSR